MTQQTITPAARRLPLLPLAVGLLAALAYGAGVITTMVIGSPSHVDRSRHTLMGRASPTYVQIREHQRLNVIESTIASADAWSTAGVLA